MLSKELIYKKQSFTAYEAQLITNIANEFLSDIYIEFAHIRANAKSLIGLISLRLQPEQAFVVIADGTDDEQAILALEQHFVG